MMPHAEYDNVSHADLGLSDKTMSMDFGSLDVVNKPMLSLVEQIEHLKAKGVTFEICQENEAVEYLRSRTYYFDLAVYRKLFDQRCGGSHDGEYVNLDFAYLRDLDRLDRDLRQLLLPMTLDVEHYAKVRIMRIIEARPDEDGYSVVHDYFESLSEYNRRYRTHEIERLRGDTYTGALIKKYSLESMPIWVFFEVISFGGLIDFYRFCALRWSDKMLLDEHYLLKQAKDVRNACAHSSNIINGFADNDAVGQVKVSVINGLAQIGISKRVRKNKMQNQRLRSIVSMLFIYACLVPIDSHQDMLSRNIEETSRNIQRESVRYMNNHRLQSCLTFLGSVLENWRLMQ